MRIRFIDQYRQYLAGDIIDCGDGVAETYIRRGLAEVVMETTERHEKRRRAVKPIERARK